MNFYDRLPIRYKLLIRYAPLIILLFVVFSLFLYYRIYSYIQSDINKELNSSTQMIKSMVSSSATASIKNNLRGVAEKNYQLIEFYYNKSKKGEISEAQAFKTVSDIIQAQKIGKTGYVFCLNKEGIASIHPESSVKGKKMTHFAFVNEILKMKDGYLEYDWKNEKETHARHKALFVKYFQPWDIYIAVSSYRDEFKDLVNIEDFQENLSSIKFFQTGYVFVCDTTGIALVHPDLQGRNTINIQDADGNYIIKEICKKRKGVLYYNWKNVNSDKIREKLVFYDYLPEYGWLVASSAYLDEVYQPLQTLMMYFIIYGILTLLIIIFLSFKISSIITTPLTNLIPKFAAGSAGNFGVRCEIKSTDEIGILYGYFNELMSKFEEFSKGLIESEEKFRTIFENSLEGMFKLNAFGDLIASNPAFTQLIELKDAFENKNIVDLIDDADLNKQDFIEKVLNGEVVKDYIIKFRRSYEESIYLSVTLQGTFDLAGNLQSIYGYAEDYTQKMESEQKLLQTHRLLMDIIEFLPDPTFVVDKDGLVVAWNYALEKLTNSKKENVIGKGASYYSLLFYEEPRSLLIDYFLLKEESLKEKYANIEIRDNTIFAEAYIEKLNIHAWGTATALIDKNGEVYGAVESIRDISEVKNAQLLIQKSEEKYREVVESANEGIAILQDAVVKYVNNQITTLFEYSKEELIGRGFLDLIHPEDKLLVAENYKKRLLNHDIISAYSFRVISKSGKYIWIETKSVMINYEGAPASLAFLTDISARIQAENELKLLNSELELRVEKRTQELNYALNQLESSNIELQTLNEHLAAESRELISLNNKLTASETKLKQANDTKDKFFSIIAHDLRNPFGGMQGLMTMLYENYPQFADEERLSILSELVKSSEKVFLLLENLLTWSLTQRGKLEYTPTMFDIHRVTEKTLMVASLNAGKKDISLHNLIPKSYRVYGDTNMITTVIRNLVTNAIKFTNENGSITCSLQEFDEYIEYCVQDDGIGMSEDVKNKLFRIDVPSSQLGTSKEKGSGLGLIICKEFVEKNGGTIRVESEPDKGSKFIFSLRKQTDEI